LKQKKVLTYLRRFLKAHQTTSTVWPSTATNRFYNIDKGIFARDFGYFSQILTYTGSFYSRFTVAIFCSNYTYSISHEII
jgi:hypothetical protein